MTRIKTITAASMEGIDRGLARLACGYRITSHTVRSERKQRFEGELCKVFVATVACEPTDDTPQWEEYEGGWYDRLHQTKGEPPALAPDPWWVRKPSKLDTIGFGAVGLFFSLAWLATHSYEPLFVALVFFGGLAWAHYQWSVSRAYWPKREYVIRDLS